MAILTPEQEQNIQNKIDTARAGVNSLANNVSSFKADQIKQQPQFKVNELAGEAPDVSSAVSELAGMKEAGKVMEARIKEQQKQLAEGKKQSSGIWDKIIGAKSTQEVGEEAAANIGFNESEYFATRKADIAEMDSLYQQYQNIETAKNEALLRIEKTPQTLRSMEGQMSAEEKRWNIRLNTMAGKINSKSAIMKLKDENYTQAKASIDKAVENYTYDLKLTYDQFDLVRQDNKELMDDLGDDFKTIYNTAQTFALQEYESAQQEKRSIGELMMNYPDAPWTADSMSLSLGEATQIAQQSTKYKLEQQLIQASIYDKYNSGTTGGLSLGFGATPQESALVDAFNMVSLNLPKAQMERATTTFQNYLNNGDTDGAKNFLVSVAMTGATADQKNQAIGRTQAINALTTIKDLLAQVPTNLVRGNLENITQKLGETTDPKLAYINSRIQQQIQVYRRSMTGVAFSPKESEEYAKIFPDITNGEKLNPVKIDALIDSFNSNNRSVLSFYLGGTTAYDNIFGKESISNFPGTKTEEAKTAALDSIVSGGSELNNGGGWWDNFLGIFGLKKK